MAHLFVTQTSERSALRAHLKDLGVATDIHYPIPDHQQNVYNGPATSLPVTEQLTERVMSLPCYPGLSDEAIDHVVASVNAFRSGGA